MKKIIFLSLVILITSVSGQVDRWQGWSHWEHWNTVSKGIIPTDGLVLLHNPGAQMITNAEGNADYPALTFGSDVVTNGTFKDFTFDDADVEDSVKGHWIFSSTYHTTEVGVDSIHHDLSGKDNDLTWNGWTSYADVKSDMSGTVHPSYENGDTLGFDGSTNYFSHADHDDFDIGTDDYTVEAWVTTGSDVTTTQKIVEKYDDTSGFSMYVGNGVVYIFHKEGGTYTQSAANVSVNTTYHIAGVADRDGNLTIYLDGASVQANSIADEAGDASNAIKFTIGVSSDEADGHFTGSIHEVRFTRSALSAQSIKESYGLGKGWSQSDTAPTTLTNSSFSQRYKPTGENYFHQTLTTTATDAYQLTLNATGNAADQTFTLKEGTTNISAATDAANGSSTAYTYYHKFASTTPSLRFTIADAEDITSDDFVVKKVTNVSAVGSDTVYNYAFTDAVGGNAISSLEDEQPAHPYSWEYDGVADYLNFGNNFDLSTNKYVLTAWVYHSNYATPNISIMSKRVSNSDMYWLYFDGGRLRILGNVGGDTQHSAYTNTGLFTNNSWHHVAVEVNPTVSIKFYVDGVLDENSTTLVNLGGDMDNSGNYQIGARSGALLWTGRLGITTIHINSYVSDVITKIYNNTSSYYTSDN